MVITRMGVSQQAKKTKRSFSFGGKEDQSELLSGQLELWMKGSEERS